MKRFLTAIALTLVLSCSVWAGELPTTNVPSPVPSETPTAPGDPGIVAVDPSGDLTRDEANALLAGLLTIVSLVL